MPEAYLEAAETAHTRQQWSDAEVAELRALYADYSAARLRAFAQRTGRTIIGCRRKAGLLDLHHASPPRRPPPAPRKRGRDRQGATHPCAICSTPIYISPHRLGRSVYFCCQEHSTAWQARGKVAATCAVCGATRRVSPSRLTSGKPYYCSLPCRDADPGRHEQLIAMNADQQRGKQTSIERIGYALLDAIGVAYRPQHLVGGKFCVDAFVSEAALVIQFDGDYWHGHPERFPAPDARQRRRIKLDQSQDAYMAACGYRVLRLWEAQLRRDPAEVTLLLRRALAP